jgi:hypothetical protein
MRHTTLTDVERIAGVCTAGGYAGHADMSFGVTGIYTKVSMEELRLAHSRLFFDPPADPADPSQRPQLFRRPLPAAAGAVSFMDG